LVLAGQAELSQARKELMETILCFHLLLQLVVVKAEDTQRANHKLEVMVDLVVVDLVVALATLVVLQAQADKAIMAELE
jgi:hypothetical protein